MSPWPALARCRGTLDSPRPPVVDIPQPTTIRRLSVHAYITITRWHRSTRSFLFGALSRFGSGAVSRPQGKKRNNPATSPTVILLLCIIVTGYFGCSTVGRPAIGLTPTQMASSLYTSEFHSACTSVSAREWIAFPRDLIKPPSSVRPVMVTPISTIPTGIALPIAGSTLIPARVRDSMISKENTIPSASCEYDERAIFRPAKCRANGFSSFPIASQSDGLRVRGANCFAISAACFFAKAISRSKESASWRAPRASVNAFEAAVWAWLASISACDRDCCAAPALISASLPRETAVEASVIASFALPPASSALCPKNPITLPESSLVRMRHK